MLNRAVQVLATLLLLDASDAAAADSTGKPEPSLLPARASAICDEVVRLTNEGRIQDRVLTFNRPTRQEEEAFASLKKASPATLLGVLPVKMPAGRPKHLAVVVEGGSCGGQTIIDYDAAISSGKLELDVFGEELDDNDPLRWARWGTLDHLLLIDGQVIVIAANFVANPTNVRLASWLGSTQQTPLCAFQASGKIILRAPSNASPVCDAVVAGEASILPWTPVTEHEAAAARIENEPRRWDSRPELVATAAADVDGDGKEDRVGLERRHSGSGCGSTAEFLSQLGEDGKRRSDTALARALGDEDWGPTYPGETDHQRGRLSLVTHQGRAYILGKHRGQTGIFYIQGDRVQPSCTLGILPQIEIGASYFPR